eukprot:TRINITY_DN11743_c0_g1_i1.p1 TRINITY_DN11743_c0_g1~~TRINITY_DN11743_c0_g1_i1.p1  ORF type:complete len:521 (+),score=52.86 TRINITY_DN11743_c0_g1_i1:146-1708(+)
MPNACQRIFDVDIDDLFAYKADRRVIIRDRRLGIARVLIIVILFVYVVIYEVVMQKGYLIKDEPVGFNTISVRRGSDWNNRQDHCCPGGGCGTCAGTVPTCAKWTTEDSCTRSGCDWSYAPSRTNGSNTKLECVGWDRHNILNPSAEEYSSLITTRIKVTEFGELPKHCDLNASSSRCPGWEPTDVKSYYTSGIEEMTVMIDHGVYGHESNKILKGQDMSKGVMKLPDGELHFCGGSVLGMANNADVDCTEQDRERPGDIFTVEQLLLSSGIGSLEEIYEDESLRYNGVVILVILSYDGEGIDTELSYTYRSFALRGVEFKNEQSVITDLPSGNITRSVWKRHGIRIVLVPTGYIAIFSFVELMKTLMVAGSLFSLAKVLVEHVLLRFLPYSTVYKRYRDIKTVNFSDHDKNDLLGLNDVHYVFGEVRHGGTIDPSDEEEKEVGDKIDDKVNAFKHHHPLPSFLQPGGVTSTDLFSRATAVHPESASAVHSTPLLDKVPNNHPANELSYYLMGGEPDPPL